MFCRHKIFCGHHNSNDTCALVDTFSFVDVVDFKSDDVFKSRWIMTSPVPRTTFIMLSCLHVSFCLRFKMIGGSPKFLGDFLQEYSRSRYAEIPEDPTEPARLNFRPSRLAMVKKDQLKSRPKKKEGELRVKALVDFDKASDDESMPRLEAILEELSLDPDDRMEPMQADTFLLTLPFRFKQ